MQGDHKLEVEDRNWLHYFAFVYDIIAGISLAIGLLHAIYVLPTLRVTSNVHYNSTNFIQTSLET